MRPADQTLSRPNLHAAASLPTISTMVVGGVFVLAALAIGGVLLRSAWAALTAAPPAPMFLVNAAAIGMVVAGLLTPALLDGPDRRRRLTGNFVAIALATATVSAAPDLVPLALWAAVSVSAGSLLRAQFRSRSGGARGRLERLSRTLRAESVAACCLIGGLLLCALLGGLTAANVRLAGPEFGLGTDELALSYLVCIPAFGVTFAHEQLARRCGRAGAVALACSLAIIGVMLSASDTLALVVAGMGLMAASVFSGQAIVTDHLGMACVPSRGEAARLYVAVQSLGGVGGVALLAAFQAEYGWASCATVVAALFALTGLAAVVLWSAPSSEDVPTNEADRPELLQRSVWEQASASLRRSG